MQPTTRFMTRAMGELALWASLLAASGACTKTPQDKVGVGEQPAQTPERSPGTVPTTTTQGAAIKAEESPEDTDSPGTTRTPPAAPAETMDNAPAEGRGGDAGTQ